MVCQWCARVRASCGGRGGPVCVQRDGCCLRVKRGCRLSPYIQLYSVRDHAAVQSVGRNVLVGESKPARKIVRGSFVWTNEGT